MIRRETQAASAENMEDLCNQHNTQEDYGGDIVVEVIQHFISIFNSEHCEFRFEVFGDDYQQCVREKGQL